MTCLWVRRRESRCLSRKSGETAGDFLVLRFKALQVLVSTCKYNKTIERIQYQRNEMYFP